MNYYICKYDYKYISISNYQCVDSDIAIIKAENELEAVKKLREKRNTVYNIHIVCIDDTFKDRIKRTPSVPENIIAMKEIEFLFYNDINKITHFYSI